MINSAHAPNNEFGGRKVVRQATVLAHWTEKVGGRPIGSAANDVGQET